MPEETTETPPPASPPPPSEDFLEKVKTALREVLPEFLDKEPPPPPEETQTPAKRVRSLRQEESDMEHLVTTVVEKLKAKEPPAPPAPSEPVVETPPGPPPRKARLQKAMWG